MLVGFVFVGRGKVIWGCLAHLKHKMAMLVGVGRLAWRWLVIGVLFVPVFSVWLLFISVRYVWMEVVWACGRMIAGLRWCGCCGWEVLGLSRFEPGG